MTTERMISAEEVDTAISGMEEILRTCEDSSLAMVTLAGLRAKLGILKVVARRSEPRLPLFDSGDPRLTEIIEEEFGSQRTDGELDD